MLFLSPQLDSGLPFRRMTFSARRKHGDAPVVTREPLAPHCCQLWMGVGGDLNRVSGVLPSSGGKCQKPSRERPDEHSCMAAFTGSHRTRRHGCSLRVEHAQAPDTQGHAAGPAAGADAPSTAR